MSAQFNHIVFEILPRESIIEFLAVMVALGTIAILWKYRKSQVVRYLILIEFFAALWALAYGIEFTSYNLESKKFWSELSYLGIAFLPLCYFLFTAAFSQKTHFITPRNITLLSVIPFITIPLALTSDYHTLIWKEVTLDASRNMTLIEHGTWFWIFWAYSIALILAGIFNLFRSIYTFTSYYKSQVGTLLIATLIPLIGNVMYVTGLTPIPGFDWTPVLFVFTGLVITFGIVKYRMFNLVPFARNKLIDTMSNGVIVINSEGFIEDYNPAVKQIFNLENKSIIRKPFSEIFGGYKNLLTELKTGETQLTGIETDGPESPHYYQVQISPVYSENQQLSGHLIQINDITSLKKTENKLKETNQQLKTEVEERGRLIDDLDSFAHAVAHDLRSSLGSVYSFSEIIQESIKENDTAMLEDMASHIRTASKKAMNITQELLILATVSHQDIERKPLDMARIFSDAKKQIQQSIAESNAQITAPDEWPQATGHATWVEEVWVNYLTNSIKYGGSPPEIIVGACITEANMARFWIQDNGQGISPRDQHLLFKKYTRLAPEKADGYGLGLSIVKRIVEKLDGKVGIESNGEKGKGAKFWFELPLN